MSKEKKTKPLKQPAVNSRFIKMFEEEWKKRSRMSFEWEWVEDAGCINKTECRKMIKSILKQLQNGC